MNNLTTRKIVLGLLMGLVLAFSMQGIADAQQAIISSIDQEPDIIETDGMTDSRQNFFTFDVSHVDPTDTVTIAVTTVPLEGGWKVHSYSAPSNFVGPATADPISASPLLFTAQPNVASTGRFQVNYTVSDHGEYTFTVNGTHAFTAYAVRRGTDNHANEITLDTSTLTDSVTNPRRPITVTTPNAWTQVNFSITNGKLYRTASSNNDVTSLSTVAEVDRKTEAYVEVDSGKAAKVTASISGSRVTDGTKVATYFWYDAQLKRVSGNMQIGYPGHTLIKPLVVQVQNGSDESNVVSEQKVTFTASSGEFRKTVSGQLENSPIVVETDNSGKASVYLKLPGNAQSITVTPTIPDADHSGSGVTLDDTNFTVYAVRDRGALSGYKIDTTDPGTTSTPQTNSYLTENVYYREPVSVKVAPGMNVPVTFEITNGSLFLLPEDEDLPAESPNYVPRLSVSTDTGGIAKAYVRVDSGQTATVTAWIDGRRGIDEATYIVTYFWTSAGTPGTTTPPTTAAPRLTITASSTGATRTVTVNAINAVGTLVTGIPIVLGSLDFTLSETVTTGTATEITLPSTPGNYRLLAADPVRIYAQGSVTVTVAAPAALGTLTITTVGASVNRQQTIQVTARKADGTVPGETFSVALTGAGISRTVDILPNGSGRAIITLPATAGPHTLTVRADGYTDGAVTLTTTGQTTTTTTTTTRGPVGEADSVEIDGQRQLSSAVNQATRLRVRVLDANDNGVSDVRVTFRVLAPGRGTFAGSRGNGRATQDQTDRNGYASTNFTPTGDGDTIVRASAAGVRDPVTFIIDVGEASADTETPTPSRDVAPSRDISPVVHLGAASRPPMLWVDGGAIYALVGASEQRFAPSVDNALNIAIGGGKVYWTEMTGESAGTINSANLNGSDVTELASIQAVPMGIAVDAAGSKLYWTNSRGRIQSADLDGSGITNVIPGGLESPMDLALAGSNLYWTQGNGSVRVVNLRGQQVVRNVSTGTDTPGSVVIGGSKVYWTEMTGDGSGTINSANLSGTDVTELTSIQAVPMGIAVDGSRSKLYWTNSRGRVQSANLDGSGIINVVSGLGSPAELVLSNSIAAPAAAPAGTASGSKYDVNGDGSVNNADSDAITVAIAAGATDAKYDVNGDGTVNVFDLVEIIANRDPGAAGAPTLFGMKMTAVQIDHIEEQIDLLIATNDRSPAAMRTLIYLQQLLVTARPEKTQLLANYPNPFNPETWIPYELATDTNVRITIYNTQGVVIRTLQLGHQSGGYYTGRDRAAYWDGRNALGEQVASGVYFYQLETDEMSLMRKMVILK